MLDFLFCLVFVVLISGKQLPSFIYLYPPFTPFNNDSTFSLNLDAIPSLAQTSYNLGANLVWVGGTTGQFDSLTANERKSILNAWVKESISKSYNFYIVFNVGSTVQSESIDLASYAYNNGADAIASVPPYYEHCSTANNFSSLFSWFEPMVTASNNLPFFYYHIPSMTGYNIKIKDLLDSAIQLNLFPALTGVKYVSLDLEDWYSSTQTYGDRVKMIFCNSPQLQWFSLGTGSGVVLMDYWIPQFKCMDQMYKIQNYNTNTNGTYYYQNWKTEMSNMLGGKESQRCIYSVLNQDNMDIGPARPPLLNYTKQQCDQVIQQLNASNFFNQLQSMQSGC